MKSGNQVSVPTELEELKMELGRVDVASLYAKMRSVVSLRGTPAAETLLRTLQRPATGQLAAEKIGQATRAAPAGMHVPVLMVVSLPASNSSEMSVFSMIVCFAPAPLVTNECLVPAEFV